MAPAPRRSRLLLLQIRSNPISLRQERTWFAERCGVPGGDLATINLVERPAIRWRDVEAYDAILIGGAGAHTAYENHPFTEPLRVLVERLIERDRPLFGSCWGHQFLARVLGGTVIDDPAASEVGTYDIELTDAGRKDPLFSGLPEVFPAQLGHHDRIETLPGGLVELARSRRCPFQAIRIPGKPVYSTQFHPEMTADQLHQRLEVYRHEYIPDPEEYAALQRSLRPSPEADTILRRFIELYVD